MNLIILRGFGDLNDPEVNDNQREEIYNLAEEKGLEFYPTYYDWNLEGSRNKIAEILKEVYGLMDDDEEWKESGFEIIYLENEDKLI